MNKRISAGVFLVFFAISPLYTSETEDCVATEVESPNAALSRCSEVQNEKISELAVPVIGEVQEKVSAQASSASATDASESRLSDSLTDLLPLLQGAITPANTSSDGMPIVLNFNSPPFLRGKTSLQATLVEPKAFAPLAEKFDPAVRDAETKKLLDQAGGFGDATYSLGWSPIRRAGNWSTKRQLFGRETITYRPLIDEYSAVLLGEFTRKATEINSVVNSTLRNQSREVAMLAGISERDVFTTPFFRLREKARGDFNLSRANELIDQLAEDFRQDDLAPRSKTAEELGMLLGISAENVLARNFVTLREDARLKAEKASEKSTRADHLINEIQAGINAISKLEGVARAKLDERDTLEQRFAYLIGNQPDLQVRASYRDADAAVGPRDFAVTIEYSAGTLNFNRLLDDYQGLIEQRPDISAKIEPEEQNSLKVKAFNDITDQAIKGDLWRTSYSITYRKISDYDEKFAYDLNGVGQMAELSVPGVEEWKLRFNFSHLAGPEPFKADARPRLEYSVEGTWIQEDADIPEAARRQDRVLGRITYTVPTTDNLTFPVSIVFANRPEFLMEDKDLKNQLSAHVGLSYKLPRPGSVVKKPE